MNFKNNSEKTNWRFAVISIVSVVVLVGGFFALYEYQKFQNQQEQYNKQRVSDIVLLGERI